MKTEINYKKVEKILKTMTPYMATGIAEGFEPATSAEEQVAAWQFLVNTGMAYRLQGWFGRTAEDLIEQGIITRVTV